MSDRASRDPRNDLGQALLSGHAGLGTCHDRRAIFTSVAGCCVIVGFQKGNGVRPENAISAAG